VGYRIIKRDNSGCTPSSDFLLKVVDRLIKKEDLVSTRTTYIQSEDTDIDESVKEAARYVKRNEIEDNEE
jgi:hypothetical protein